MLYDKGLATPEQIKQYKEYRHDFANGCISSLLCENCNHIISDSICLCACYFVCPNCKTENGIKLRTAVTIAENSMKPYNGYYTIAFDKDEKQQLLFALKEYPELRKRVLESNPLCSFGGPPDAPYKLIDFGDKPSGIKFF